MTSEYGRDFLVSAFGASGSADQVALSLQDATKGNLDWTDPDIVYVSALNEWRCYTWAGGVEFDQFTVSEEEFCTTVSLGFDLGPFHATINAVEEDAADDEAFDDEEAAHGQANFGVAGKSPRKPP